MTWTDGRVLISGNSQQDVFFDKINLAVGTPTPTVTGTLSPTPTRTNTATATNTPTATACVPGQTDYVFAAATATIIAGVTDVGNHCDDCVTTVSLPFPVMLYDQSFSTSINVSSNGTLQFSSAISPFTNACLPNATHNNTIFPYWDDLLTDGAGEGIFTTVVGSAPNRTFVVEWRAGYFSGGGSANFEVLLHENSPAFETIYGTVTQGNTSATVGVQRDTGSRFTEYACNGSGGAIDTGLRLNWTLAPCGTPGPTPTPTATACGAPAQWTAGPNFPVNVIRAWGAWFPPNSRFYTLGGRTSDAAGSDIRTPYEYDPVANTWTQKTATFPDGQVNNMVGGVLNGPSGWRVYVVGGSAAAATTATARVMVYDPVADTLTELTTDPWPGNAAGDTLPGGGAVYNNRLYVLGGFIISPGAMLNTIWEFNPNGAAGSRWTLKTGTLGTELGYIPATTIGNYIYTAGGSEWDGTTLIDSDASYRYDPVTDMVTPIASIPRMTAETKAVTVGSTMWVLGGGRVAPNPSNEVDIYNPATNSWSVGLPFATARRNFPADVDPATGRVYLVGGYAPTTATNSMQIYIPAVPCATETPTPAPPTNTPTVTNTPAATATATSAPSWELYLPAIFLNADTP
jgi:hypothetical protein